MFLYRNAYPITVNVIHVCPPSRTQSPSSYSCTLKCSSILEKQSLNFASSPRPGTLKEASQMQMSLSYRKEQRENRDGNIGAI